MERRIRPIFYLFDKAMFEWIDVTIINMRGKIAVASDGMFPITALPNAPLTLRSTGF